MVQNRLLVTGPPGCGKTTLIQNVIKTIRSKQIPCDGFYTEEVRVNGVRQGFDVVLVNGGSRYPLAYISNIRADVTGPKVGRYVVDVSSFESAIRQIFDQQESLSKVLIIDEIGKMELFSDYFKKMVKLLYGKPSNVILASIPAERKKLPFVEQLCQSPAAELITVNMGNRDLLVNELSARIVKLYSQIKM